MQHAIVRAFAWAGGLTLLLAIAGGALLGSTFLRRIDTITRTSRAIMEGDLSARIPVRGTHDEIDQLVASLNAMLARIQQLMDGLRQVSSDIAHDLRTPLGRLRQHLEDARERATTTADYDAATDAAIEEADALLETFSALLRIAQVEAGAQKSAFAEVDLSALAAQHRRGLSAGGRGFAATSSTIQVEDGVHLTGDRQLLAQMISNLVENALHHTPDGTTVSLGLRKTGAGFEAEVADNGPGIPADRARQGVRPLLPPRPQPLDRRQRPRPRAGQGDRRPARPVGAAGRSQAGACASSSRHEHPSLALDSAHDLRGPRPDRPQHGAAAADRRPRDAGRHPRPLPLRHAAHRAVARPRDRPGRPVDAVSDGRLRHLGAGGGAQPDGRHGAAAARHGRTQLRHRPRLFQERGHPGRPLLRDLPGREPVAGDGIRDRPGDIRRRAAVAAPQGRGTGA